MEIFYKVPVPYSFDQEVQVYGERDMGWYEWRVMVGQRVIFDSKEMGYGSPGIALRDALIKVTSDEWSVAS